MLLGRHEGRLDSFPLRIVAASRGYATRTAGGTEKVAGIILFAIFQESNCFSNKGNVRIFITPPIRDPQPFAYTRNWPQNPEIQKIFARSAIGLSLSARISHFFFDDGYNAVYSDNDLQLSRLVVKRNLNR